MGNHNLIQFGLKKSKQLSQKHKLKETILFKSYFHLTPVCCCAEHILASFPDAEWE